MKRIDASILAVKKHETEIGGIARAAGVSSARDFCGHGVGQIFRDAPQVAHEGKRGTGIVLGPGMFFAMEPMVKAGGYQVKVPGDKWTAVTRDHSLSAQFEYTVAVTEDGVVFLPTYSGKARLFHSEKT